MLASSGTLGKRVDWTTGHANVLECTTVGTIDHGLYRCLSHVARCFHGLHPMEHTLGLSTVGSMVRLHDLSDIECELQEK